MMQHVATAKSEVAAFATGPDASSMTEPDLNKQFDKLLQQSSDEINKVSSSAQPSQPSTKFKSTSNSHTKNLNTEIISLSKGELVKQFTVKDDTFDINTQEWVSLVDNLQKLADIAQLTKSSIGANKEQVVDTLMVGIDENLLLQTEPTKLSGDISIVDVALDDVLLNPESLMPADLTLVEDKSLLKTSFIDTVTVTDKAHTLDKPVDVQQVETNSPAVSKTENMASNTDIKNILNLSDKQLDRVLENIVQLVFDNKKSAESIGPEKFALPIVNVVESSSKEFISAMKSGIEEFKDQLSQGREPGIDLKAMLSNALAKTNESGAVSKAPVNLEQVVKSVSHVLDLAQSMNRMIEQNHEQTYSASLKDIAQIQGEQSKQIQLNQVESKFEKAINIAKPEGHQQLAEKVRWMMNTKNLVAEIRLDPAELGSVHVKVALSGESATVNFVVQSQQARDAVDTATPRLREMLAEKGIELGQSSVRQESDGRRGQGDGELSGQKSHSDDGTGTENAEVPEQTFAQQNIINGAIGGIDYFV
jgi:flagellar hook-length control protein FliK